MRALWGEGRDVKCDAGGGEGVSEGEGEGEEDGDMGGRSGVVVVGAGEMWWVIR